MPLRGYSWNELTEREIEFLKLLAEGKNLGQISLHFRYQRQWAEETRTKIYAKLEARNAAHAVAVGFRRGILS
jgi:DNA-binding CsgD family transcriptional regulator